MDVTVEVAIACRYCEIEHPDRYAMAVTYTIEDFTVGNSTVRPGLDNEYAVWDCH